MNSLSRIFITGGIVMLAAGIILQFAHKVPWLGRLPGDIYIQRQNFSFYFPLASCILISIILSLILYLLGRR